MNTGEETSGTDEGSDSKTPTKQSKTPTTLTKPAVKSDAEKTVATPATLRVKMVSSQAGILWGEGKDKKGKTIPVKRGEFVRNPGHEYDIPHEEALRLIEAGTAVEAKAA